MNAKTRITHQETLDTGTPLDPYPFSMLHDKGEYTVELFGKTAHGLTLDEAARNVMTAAGLIKKPEHPHWRSEGLFGKHEDYFFHARPAVSVVRRRA